MASKCRNVFHKNKKQETTEIGCACSQTERDTREGEDLTLECRFSPQLTNMQPAYFWWRTNRQDHDNVAIQETPLDLAYKQRRVPAGPSTVPELTGKHGKAFAREMLKLFLATIYFPLPLPGYEKWMRAAVSTCTVDKWDLKLETTDDGRPTRYFLISYFYQLNLRERGCPGGFPVMLCTLSVS
ncbi:hypothetical protein AAG570_006619 [Ranatra chinensis]|uniref:Ig-like domain-containing protein n=1 Tax=Ranatra chinensis TaxID=642074 RepID=A0ABD0YV57_9HEMI